MGQLYSCSKALWLSSTEKMARLRVLARYAVPLACLSDGASCRQLSSCTRHTGEYAGYAEVRGNPLFSASWGRERLSISRSADRRQSVDSLKNPRSKKRRARRREPARRAGAQQPQPPQQQQQQPTTGWIQKVPGDGQCGYQAIDNTNLRFRRHPLRIQTVRYTHPCL